MTPAQKVIVKTWERITESQPWCESQPYKTESIYAPADLETAATLGLPVESVSEALVLAGKRPPLWWQG